MSSLLPLIPCSRFSPNNRPRPLPKPSSPRLLLRVRCCINDNNTPTPHLDRRNLLVGMGAGLYGATNLESPQAALASPISSPEFSKCTRPTNLLDGSTLDVNCCPPPSDRIIDYKLPPVTAMRFRPAAHLAGPEYVAKYEKALNLMKALPADDPRSFTQQANVHCAYCNLTYPQNGDPDAKLQIHFNWLFFPWHRWYLYFYERILGKLIDDPTFGLPFWNWDHPKGMFMPEMFNNEGSPLYDAKRNQNHLPGQRNGTANLRYDGKDAPSRYTECLNLQEVYNEVVGTRLLTDFYGARYVTGGTASEPGQGSIERGSHTALHWWVGDPREPYGEDMGNFYSAGREPLFFSHHANVDRLWSLYRGLRTYRGLPAEFKSCEWLDANFLFYDENAQLVRVRVGDTLENESMGYTFQKVGLPWLNYKRDKACHRPVWKPKRKAAAAEAIRSRTRDNPAVFPLKLDKVVRVLVDRPKKSRSREEKEKEEELLVIQGIEVDASKFVRFEVFVNDEDDDDGEVVDKAEYAGCYSQVPHKSSGEVVMKSVIRLGLSELLEDLDADDDDQVMVSLVPQAGGEDVIIGGIKIIYDDDGADI